MEKKDVFISYRASEADVAFAVRTILESNGISCWIAPDCISGGSDYSKEIPVAIKNCSVFVLMLSKKAQRSQWVRKELASAIGMGKTILPFTIEKFNLNKEFNFYLSNVQRYEAFVNKSEILLNMINEINRILGRELITPPESDKENWRKLFKEDIFNEKIGVPIYGGLKKLTPFGLKEAEDPLVRFPLNVVSILTAIVFFPMILTCITTKNSGVALFGFIVAGFFCWFASSLFCIRIGNLKIKNKFIAAMGAIAGFAITLTFTIIIAIAILKRFVW